MKRIRSNGFSLIELLVVISVIAVLVAILLPALGKARAAGRSAACMSNQRQTVLALINYTTSFRDMVVPNQQQIASPKTVIWWFGEEAGGPASVTTPNRPLDKTRSPLAPYFGGDIQDGLKCPDFPRDDVRFFPKFNVNSAHFGYNESIAPLFFKNKPPRRLHDIPRTSAVMAFADALHMDGINKTADGTDMVYEPHYVQHSKFPGWRSGFGHFRHQKRANVAMLDGHVTARRQTEPTFDIVAGDAVANLDASWGAGSIYGFDTGF